MSPYLKRLSAFTAGVLVVGIAYYLYVLSVHPPSPERETFISEIGEGIGEVALWVFVAIYVRTAVKLLLGKGPMARRLLPNYQAPAAASFLDRMVVWLDRTHVFLGIAAVVLVLLHIALLGLHPAIWFFPVVLALVLWQAVFGIFLSWRGSPRDLRKFAFGVHAQLATGVAISVFAYLGHLLIDE